MTASRDPDRLIHQFLLEGEEDLQDVVYDAVRGEIEQTRQRTTFGPWRTPAMTKFLVYGLGAAAVVLALVVGVRLLSSPTGGTGGPGGEPTTTPDATATLEPTPAPSSGARFPSWYPPAAVADANGGGILTPGSHATQNFEPAFSFSAPEGWVNAYDEPGYFTLFPDTPANQAAFASSDELAHHVFIGLHGSPWFTCESAENNRGATAAAMVTAASATEALAVSDAVEVAIGGLTGMQFDVRRNPDWTGACPGDSALPDGVDPQDERTRVVLLDAPGRGVLVIFMYSASSGEHDAFVTEAMPIIESFEFSQ
jgi:hypothetical protein